MPHVHPGKVLQLFRVMQPAVKCSTKSFWATVRSPPLCSARSHRVFATLLLFGHLNRYGIIALEIDREKLEPVFLRRFHPSSVRWLLIQRFLEAKGLTYGRVLMVDAGETFFQGSPFDIIGDPGSALLLSRVVDWWVEHGMNSCFFYLKVQSWCWSPYMINGMINGNNIFLL